MVFHLRTRHPLLRLVSCVGGHTPHTRLQALVCMYNQIIVSAALVLTFYGSPQCDEVAALFVAFLGALIAFILCTLLRLVLKMAYLRSEWGRAAHANWKEIRKRSVEAGGERLKKARRSIVSVVRPFSENSKRISSGRSG